MGKKGVKQVDVINRIINCIENDAKIPELINDKGEMEVDILTLVTEVFDTEKPTKSQFNSVYRAVDTLEKKGLAETKKIKPIGKVKVDWGGKRYEKEIIFTIINGRINRNEVLNSNK